MVHRLIVYFTLLYISFIKMLVLFQLVCSFIILMCANVLGLYHKYVTDVAHRKTFLDARNFMESKLRLEREKQQQVG